jgi:outer membrane protein OmpA-like peptidoglycan-associated protein
MRSLSVLTLAALLLAGPTVAAPKKKPAAAPAAQPAAAPAANEEVNAVALLAGARQVNEEGTPTDASALLFDGLAESGAQWEPAKTEPTISAIIQLAEPFDLTRAQAINSLSEGSYPGISTKRLRLEYASNPAGPWKKLADATLKKSTSPQPITLTPTKGVRYLKVTLLENYGEENWWSLAELAVYGKRSQPRATVNFSGVWQTGYGEMVLTQEGQRVWGCYGSGETKAGDATVDGTLEGPIFFGTFLEKSASGGQEAQGRGAIAFALTAERELSGVWGNDVAGKDRTGRWDGTPQKKASLTCEKPEKDLGAELKKSGRVVLRGILFDTGKDVLRPESEPVLEALAKAMKGDPKSRYIIEGHTDNRGGEAMNQDLSDRRAARVKSWLVAAGIDGGRLDTKGYGQSRPALPNDSEAGRAANRRVEVAIK